MRTHNVSCMFNLKTIHWIEVIFSLKLGSNYGSVLLNDVLDLVYRIVVVIFTLLPVGEGLYILETFFFFN